MFLVVYDDRSHEMFARKSSFDENDIRVTLVVELDDFECCLISHVDHDERDRVKESLATLLAKVYNQGFSRGRAKEIARAKTAAEVT